MKNIVVTFILLVTLFGASAHCAMALQGNKKITMDPCVMSYTDTNGRETFVIRSASLIIFIK